MNLKEIEALVTVARSKSFYEAAYALNYSPSVISKYVSNLEEELGVVLFTRSNRASSVCLTKEGVVLLPHFISMHERCLRLHNDAAALREKNDSLLRIGTGHQLCSPGVDEIMADFFHANADTRIEQTKLDFESQIHSLYSGQQDGVFFLVKDGSVNAEALASFMKDPKIESYLLVRERDMYLGISENEPLSTLDSAPFEAFRNFSIAFLSNQAMLQRAGTMTPFRELCAKIGIDLKPIYIDPRDTSAFYLATQMKIAVPSLRGSFKYPGVKFVRVEDWEATTSSYFVVLRGNSNPALTRFKKSVRAFLKQPESKT
jgi:DNA-binding transcriptional LysR family regulator